MKNFLPRRARRGENASACETAQNRFRLFHTVHGGGKDAARVARALAAGVKAAEPDGLAVLAARNAHRRRRARFHTGQHGVGGIVAAQPAAEHRAGFAHRLDGEGGQTGAQIGRGNAGGVRRADGTQARARAPGKKILHPLRGGAVIAAAGEERGALPFALERDAHQRPFAAEIGRLHVDKQRGVGVFAVAREAAHAVGDDSARLARRGDHLAARAHAERVRAASVFEMLAQAVIGRAERRVLREAAVLRGVDKRLRMLHARADRKRLGDHRNAERVQHFKRVPRAVADGENEALAGDFVLRAGEGTGFGRAKRALRDDQARQLRFKPRFAAEGDDLVADADDGFRQLVRADVGACFPEDLLRCARGDERLEHGAAAGILDAAVELAVGEHARAALAELHVALLVERAARAEGCDVALTRVGLSAAFEQNRAESRARKPQGCKQPGRAAADDDGVGRIAERERGDDNRRGGLDDFSLYARRAAENSGFIAADGNVEREGEVYVVTLARIDRAAIEPAGEDIARGKAERFRGEGGIGGGGEIEGGGEVGDSDHGKGSFG